MRLDRTDSAIISALQRNAGLSNKELASKVELAPSSCLERVRRLRKEGVLKGFHADVSPEALGIGLQAIIAIRVSSHQEDKVVALREQLIAHPEVINFYYLAGRTDFLVHVAVRDVDHLRALGAEAITSQKIVDQVETSLIFDYRRSPMLPDYSQHASKPRARS